MQHRRTPAGRRQLRFIDEQLINIEAERRAGDSDAVRVAREADGPSASAEDVARHQRELLEDLRSGHVRLESTPDREVAAETHSMTRSGLLIVAHCAGQ